MNPDSGEENGGGMADRTRSRTQHLSDEEERTEKLRVHVLMEQESSGGVGPGTMEAPREPLNVIPTTFEMIQSTLPRVMSLETTPLETSPEIRAMQATITEMANNISGLVQAVSRLSETNRTRRSVSAASNVSHRSGSEQGFRVEGGTCSFFRKGKCKDGERCRFSHSLPLDGPRGVKLRYDGGGQGSLLVEVMNVSDPRNSKAPLQGTDDRGPISARINASSVGGNSGGVTKENNIDSRFRPVVASTVSLLAGESVQRILSRKDSTTTNGRTHRLYKFREYCNGEWTCAVRTLSGRLEIPWENG